MVANNVGGRNCQREGNRDRLIDILEHEIYGACLIFTYFYKKIVRKCWCKEGVFYKVQRRELKQMVVVVSFQVRQLPGEASDNFCLILENNQVRLSI